jgi:hypothetical protein
MKNDSTLAAVRKTRCDISREHGNDPARLVQHYRELQARFTGRLIRGPAADDNREEAAEQAAAADSATRCGWPARSADGRGAKVGPGRRCPPCGRGCTNPLSSTSDNAALSTEVAALRADKQQLATKLTSLEGCLAALEKRAGVLDDGRIIGGAAVGLLLSLIAWQLCRPHTA